MILQNSRQKGTILVAVSALIAGSILFVPRIAQSSQYHNFADTRRILAIPNFWNVVSNMPFIVIGVVGLYKVYTAKAGSWLSAMYYSLFLGVLFTGFGSAWYHLSPNNNTLVWDRLPMTIVFMAFLSTVIAEWISPKVGLKLFIPLLLVGISSVWWWHHTEEIGQGDLRLYGLVQFYPILLIPLIITLYYKPFQRAHIWLFLYIVLWYILAKLFELLDNQVYRHFPLSGHTLKHLAASISTYYFVPVFTTRYAAKRQRSDINS